MARDTVLYAKHVDRGGATFNVQSFGAKGDGTTDDRAAFVAAEAAGDDCTAPAGTYSIASNWTITKAWDFRKGALLKPASGVVVTVGASARIYAVAEWRDTSAGGSFAYEDGAGIDATQDGPTGGYGPSIVRGFAGNAIAADVGSASIAGGGAEGFNNVIGGATDNVNTSTPNEVVEGTGAHYSAIIGGYDNVASGLATILGGFHNYVESAASHGTILGGSINAIDDGDYCTIVAGHQNSIKKGNNSFIGGGTQNTVNPSTGGGVVIAGGFNNEVTGDLGTIGGGSTNTVTAAVGTVAGGIRNDCEAQRGAIGGGDTNVIGSSATYGVIGGGFTNTVNAFAGAIPGGQNNTVNGQFSGAQGLYAISRLYGEQAHAAGRFAAAGDAQVMRLVARNTTTDATETEMYLDGVDDLLVIPDSTTWTFRVQIAARCQSTGESAGYTLVGVIDRGLGAATTALVGTVTKTEIAEDESTWDVAATADATNGALSITVTGEAARSIKWVALVEIVQVTG